MLLQLLLRGSNAVPHVVDGQEEGEHPCDDAVLDHVHETKGEEALDNLTLTTGI